MKKNVRKHSPFQRFLAFALAVLMVMGYIPASAHADTTVVPGTIDTVADPQTLTRPETIYGTSTVNAGKVTVGKSVSDEAVSIEYDTNETQTFTPATNNFIVTMSQSAQVMGLSTESAVPIDAVFVLDTSGSMDDDDRAENLVTAANNAISALMKANENNRVAVVGFSSGGYGSGSSGNAAASIMSPLAHYTGDAASSHLQWVNSNGSTTGNDKRYIAGRDSDGTIGDYREGYNGGTNIQAGIATGAKILTAANPTLTYEDGSTVTRVPILVIISDGQPTFTCTSTNWYNPTIPTARNNENGPGGSSYEGNGFLAALTAAYYKGVITEHYYGEKASETDRCFVYTVGVDIEALDDTTDRGQTVSRVDDNQALAETTLDPVSAIAGTANSTYYTYGNSWNDNNPTTTHSFKTYWEKYVAGSNFTIRTSIEEDRGQTTTQTFTVTAASITATKNAVMGKASDGTEMYTGGLGYNDAYYSASSGDLNDVFTSLVTEINKKAMSSPTHVSTGGDHNFEGYVTFTDVLGEYMEVKDMKGILADGNFYQGTKFTDLLKSGADEAFNATLKEILRTRMNMTNVQATDEFLDAFIASARAAAIAAGTNADNSITWWGSEYNSGEEDTNVALLAHAADDSISYIEECRAAGTIPAEADYVCRSYFFYGTAGGTVTDANHEYMYFVVRVQRSLIAPYQQTVVVSIPASLLSVDEVFITESTDDDGNTVYTAEVTDVYPTRVIYEVGLRSDINAENVASIVSEAYANEEVNGEGSINYDASTGTYYFFTNDWDRTQSLESHHRAMTKATFDAASDNAFYTYQQDTLLLNEDGTPYTGEIPLGKTLYYARDVYTWDTSVTNEDGSHPAVKSESVLIAVTLPSTLSAGSTDIKQVDGQWYISKGVYASTTLQVTGDDTTKTENKTNTSSIVAHPHRTGDSSNSHYTVLLGNNGMLSLVRNPAKTVDITTPEQVTIENADGQPVMVGDILTYHVKVTNSEDTAADVVITDSVPAGTSFVKAENDGVYDETTGIITWTMNLKAGDSVTVSFQVLVTDDVVGGSTMIENTATVKLGNNPEYTTNTTENPPEGKKVTTPNNASEVQVGDTLTYWIRAYNDAVDANGQPVAATVIVTDVIPQGTTYVENSADHGGVYDAATRTITWTLTDMAADTSVTLSFDVKVDASAKVDPSAEVQPEDGTIELTNTAEIKVGENDPRQTNETSTPAPVGDLMIAKTFAEGTNADHFADKTFTLALTETGGKLSGTYVLDSSNDDNDGTVTFVNGTATVTIKGNESIVIKGIPVGATITLAEVLDATADAGWSVSAYTPTPASVTITGETGASADITIENKYTVTPVSFQLKGTKNVTGNNFPDGRFSFTATLTDENGDVILGTDGQPVRRVTAQADVVDGQSAVFAFSERSFSSEQTLYYLIQEEASTLPGVTSAVNQYLVKLVIEDVNSQLVATTWYKARANSEAAWPSEWTAFNWKDDSGDISTDELVFTNAYDPADATVTISGTKALTGRDLREGEFSFQLVYGNKVEHTATNAADGTFSFPALVFSAEDMFVDGEPVTEKTFIFYIREVTENPLANVDYDLSYYQVDITITDVNGQLSETKRVITKYVMGDDGKYVTPGTVVESISYTNKYNTQDVQVRLSGVKNLTGNGADGLAANDFSFQVIQTDESFTPILNDGRNKIVASANNAADADSQAPYQGAVSFTPINYTVDLLKDVEAVDGVKTMYFYYIVKEVIPYGEPTYFENMKYDTTEHQVVVKLTLNTNTGVMEARIVSVDGTAVDADSYSELSFTNIKNPETVTYSPVGKKTTNTEADSLPDNLRFSFRVTSLDGSVVEGTGISAAAVKGTPVDITFTAMEYDYSDVGNTYFYLIEEATVNMSDGVTYSDARYVLAITVGKDANNALTVTPVYYDVTGVDLAAVQADPQTELAKLTPLTEAISFTNTYNAEKFLNITAKKTLTGVRPLGANEFDFRLQLLTKNADGTYSTANSVVNGTNSAGSANGNGGYTGTVTFGTLNFTYDQMTDAFLAETKTGENGVTEYVYQFDALISELEPATAKIAGVTYDPAKYIVSIRWVKTVTETETEGSQTTYGDPYVHAVYAASGSGTYTAGNLLASDLLPVNGTVALGDYVSFTNSYTISEGVTATITATKTLTGRPLDAEFTFKLYRITESGDEVLVDTVSNAADEVAPYQGAVVSTRTYPAALSSSSYFGDDNLATFTYHMVEENTGAGGITYSDAEYWVKVVIYRDVANAKMEVQSVTYYSDSALTTEVDPAEVIFANTYTTNDTTFTPAAEKKLFVKKDGAWVEQETMTAGAFSFQVIETDENGNILKVPSGSQQVEKVVSTGNNTADGTVTFQPLSYVSTGTGAGSKDYYYLVREVVPETAKLPGITYTPNSDEYTDLYYLKVTVTDDGKGGLTVTASQYGTSLSGREVSGSSAEPIFANYYGPGYVTIDLDLHKTVEIEKPTTQGQIYALAGDEFDFQVYKVVEDENGVKTEVYVTSGSNGATNADGIAPIIFGSIVINASDLTDGEGTFTYIVREVPASDAADKGITIDTRDITVVVEVKNDGFGNLSYTVTHSGGSGEDADTFVNKYSAKPTELVVVANKTLTNKKLAADEFSFQLVDSEGNVVQTVKNAADGTITFEKLEFSAPGTYWYTLEEVIPAQESAIQGQPTYSYDASVYTIKVDVTDDGKGQLNATATYYKNYVADGENTPVGGMSFTNSYTPGPITDNLTLAIDATKYIEDITGKPITDGDMLAGFQFTVTDIYGAEVATGTSDAEGKITFTDMTFQQAGEYHYRISEVQNTKPGYTYDTRVWEVHILVRYNENVEGLTITNTQGEEQTVDIGELYIQQSDVSVYLYSSAAPAAEVDSSAGTVVKPEFRNVYDPTPANLVLTAKKELTGRDLREGEFTFHLVQKDSNEQFSVLAGEATNKADGSVTFYLDYDETDMMDGKGNYAKQKTFVYQIHEHAPSDAVDGVKDGVTYDPSLAEITVVVKDEGGVLKAYIGGYEASFYATGVKFENSYTTPDAEVTLQARKVLDGMDLTEGAFEFELVDSEGNVVQTVTNAADGTITFEKLTFTHAMMENAVNKAYTYTIREKAGSVPGMTYDDAVITATITLTDDQKGTLTASASYDVAPVFSNIYVQPRTTAQITATKTLTGRDLTEGEFTFELVDDEGIVATVTNDADGVITIEQGYTQAGTYTYTLREKTGAEDGMLYDANTYEVTVTVSWTADGSLSAAVAYGTEDGEAPVFENVYDPESPAITVQILAEKTLTGGDLTADAFTFELVDADGETVTAANDADGKIVFNVQYTEAGTYAYTLREKAGSALGMTYDTAAYEVTVTVTENADHTLNGSVAYGTEDGEVPVFENVYDPNATVTTAQITAEKTLTGRTLAAGEFTFELVDADNNTLSATNDADGKILFNVQYAKAGTYTYTLREKLGTVAGITYDTNTYKVTVTVTAGENGALTAAVAYDTDEGKAPVFSNSFTTVPVTVTLTGTKTLSGRTLKAGEFTFQVKDSTGALVSTGTNDAKGNITFSAITLPTAGRYVLTVTEVNSKASYVTYDTTKFTVTVEVAEENGVLSADVTYPSGGIKFVNTYKKTSSSTPGTGDNTPITLLIVVMILSAAALIVVVVLMVRRNRKNDKRRK